MLSGPKWKIVRGQQSAWKRTAVYISEFYRIHIISCNYHYHPLCEAMQAHYGFDFIEEETED